MTSYHILSRPLNTSPISFSMSPVAVSKMEKHEKVEHECFKYHTHIQQQRKHDQHLLCRSAFLYVDVKDTGIHVPMTIHLVKPTVIVTFDSCIDRETPWKLLTSYIPLAINVRKSNYSSTCFTAYHGLMTNTQQ